MPEKEPLIKFQVPKMKEVKAYLVQGPNGELLVRSEEELGEIPKKEEKKE